MQISLGHASMNLADMLRGLAVMGIILLHSIEHFNFISVEACCLVIVGLVLNRVTAFGG